VLDAYKAGLRDALGFDVEARSVVEKVIRTLKTRWL